MKYYCHFSCPLGPVTLVESEGGITHLYLAQSLQIPQAQLAKTPLLTEACRQLEEYFAGQRRTFALPLAPSGTEFQKKVWRALCQIPYGQTRTYKDIAQAISCPKGFRAVGLANNKNPIAIFIPCHRVIGANGRLVGYAGGVHLKKYLLELEGISIPE